MILSDNIKHSIDQSVLCWLATVDSHGMPNVSPKEIFSYHKDLIIVANIASPNTKINIEKHPLVCISFINNYIQKGYQIKGEAKVILRGEYAAYFEILDAMTNGDYPFESIFLIQSLSAKEIKAPSYFFYPGETEQEKIEKAKLIYHRAL